jgi:hypothetical protein
MVPGVSRAGKQSGQALWAFQTRMRTAKLRHAGAAPEDVAGAPRGAWTKACSGSF